MDLYLITGFLGAGKTTFIKLLCRLYDPQEGQILLNGTDIREYRYEEYLQLFSTVFQDYRIFAFTLGENVAAESEYDREKAVRALENAGFASRLRTLKDGLDTQLFKNFSEDGVELSGGEMEPLAPGMRYYGFSDPAGPLFSEYLGGWKNRLQRAAEGLRQTEDPGQRLADLERDLEALMEKERML